MQTRKRYTNQTFTKRVDHEGGAHRPAKGAIEPGVCKECGSIYENRRWTAKGQLPRRERFDKAAEAAMTICPACRQVREGVVGGYVNLEGNFVGGHWGEIESLIRNEGTRTLEDNPLSRIMSITQSENGGAKVETTTEHLAQRIGRALEKAYDGEVEYTFSHENKVVRVNWKRD
jgi:hypothetical protein